MDPTNDTIIGTNCGQSYGAIERAYPVNQYLSRYQIIIGGVACLPIHLLQNSTHKLQYYLFVLNKVLYNIILTSIFCWSKVSMVILMSHIIIN